MASLEERVSAMEQEIIVLRERVTDTHTLAAHADRDVAQFRTELRAQTRLLNANREDLIDLRKKVDDLETKVDQGFAKVDQGFARNAAAMEQIVALLNRLVDKS